MGTLLVISSTINTNSSHPCPHISHLHTITKLRISSIKHSPLSINSSSRPTNMCIHSITSSKNNSTSSSTNRSINSTNSTSNNLTNSSSTSSSTSNSSSITSHRPAITTTEHIDQILISANFDSVQV